MCEYSRWEALCRNARATTRIEAGYRNLLAAYSDPPRAYHNIDHVAHCLREFDALAASAEHPVAVEFAIWFHDAVYDTHRADNEQQSADFAVQSMVSMGIAGSLPEAVTSLILLTRHDTPPVTLDDCIIIDVDLAILGSLPDRFDDYEARIRREYAWVSDELFWEKRLEFLRAMLRRDAIFTTPLFRDRYEQAARRNLQRAILAAAHRLEAQGHPHVEGDRP